MFSCEWGRNSIDVSFVLVQHIWEFSESIVGTGSPEKVFSRELVISFEVDSNGNEVILNSA